MADLIFDSSVKNLGNKGGGNGQMFNSKVWEHWRAYGPPVFPRTAVHLYIHQQLFLNHWCLQEPEARGQIENWNAALTSLLCWAFCSEHLKMFNCQYQMCPCLSDVSMRKEQHWEMTFTCLKLFISLLLMLNNILLVWPKSTPVTTRQVGKSTCQWCNQETDVNLHWEKLLKY